MTARTRSPSPSPVPGPKRQKVAHPNGHKPAPCEPNVHFASGLFDPSNIAKLHQGYQTNEPFNYALVEKLFQDDLLRKVMEECRSELSFTEKETDIYKVNQTGDLASLNYLSSSEISLLPNLLTLRDALYSSEFRSFLQGVTGCGPLSGTKQDMSVNSYTKGCHLLNHDDVIGTRRVSYILYMPLPHYQLWQKDWGGALELYPVRDDGNGGTEPECVPRKSIPPSWNQFIFFEVQPGHSFHSVEEVVVGGEGEDGRQRMSISGWFHTVQEGEDGYVPESEPREAPPSSREQLTSTSTVLTPYTNSAEMEVDPPLPSAPLAEEHMVFLSEFLNPVYLQPRTMTALASRFVEESSLELHSFLSNDLAAALESRLRDLDVKDGLGPERAGRVPPHSSGVHLSTTIGNPNGSTISEGINTITLTTTPGSTGEPSPWTLTGPPHKWRYCVLRPHPPSAPVTSITPLSAHPSPSEILRVLQDELFPSAAFRAWIAIVSKLLPLRHKVEARRFRPGLDYTLATSEEKEARLDVVLGLTPGLPEDSNSQSKGRTRGWNAGEWGGWECYMAPHSEDDDPAVYRSSSGKKTPSEHSNGQAKGTSNGTSSIRTNGDAHSATTSNGGSPSNGASHSRSPSPLEDMEAEEEEVQEEDEGTLLTVQPGYNRLLLVLRDEKVMRFVKYVSAAADGSRWDVCGEYEIGMMQEDSDEDDG